MQAIFFFQEMMPGGVNSPVRAFKSVGGQPILFDSVKGSHMRDIDGNEYIDYVGSWGPAIIGHADDKVLFFSTAICIFSIYERLSFRESLGTQDCSYSILLEKWRITKSIVCVSRRFFFSFGNIGMKENGDFHP